MHGLQFHKLIGRHPFVFKKTKPHTNKPTETKPPKLNISKTRNKHTHPLKIKKKIKKPSPKTWKTCNGSVLHSSYWNLKNDSIFPVVIQWTFVGMIKLFTEALQNLQPASLELNLGILSVNAELCQKTTL